MTQPAVAANLNQPLDTHLHLAAQVTFDLEMLPNVFTQQGFICIGQILDARIRVNPC